MTPRAWLQDQPLQASEQLFAIFSSASDGGAASAWKHSMTAPASPIWADTPYAEWESVMPYVGLVSPDSGFLDWIATTDALDWGWLAVSSAGQQALAEHLRGLTQVLLPSGKPVFFRFWDGRFVLPILQSAQVDVGQLLPAIDRCLINSQSLDVGGNAQRQARAFPWWAVPEGVLKSLAKDSADCLVDNLLNWLDAEHPQLFERVAECILRRKIAHFLDTPGLAQAPRAALLEYLAQELG
ncbi:MULTISPECIES: DUF4123 domain-containing protein [Pseudomonas]|uniref:DUF4123 domain-containing protein n=1 Tax=Pseudomonas TaxID=286 RepID=UPI001BE55528|nr:MULTISPECIES: DUF4123 domain-containing protein [Pseudomonas]MBT2337866.1 DUF4123 domain-containing protein [Pseudomonas fluorescens]MCD4528368.1 DUF4123 domain-containing protein [Pseudomonas sp. C3-2018]